MQIRAINLSKDWGGVTAISQLSLDINQGDWIGIHGSGVSGKTTLASLISGMVPPSRGEIYFDSQKITRWSSRKFMEYRAKNFGLVLPYIDLIPRFNVTDNLMLQGLWLDVPSKKEFQKKVSFILEKFRLSSISGELPHRLSHSQRKKVLIARALIHEPSFLIADEPFLYLDEQDRIFLEELLKEYNRLGLTIVLFSQENSGFHSCKNIYKLEKGELVSWSRA
jgi:ABC-type lipoprotein export system ATPase subunit